jgi:hypothetical protein
LASHLDRHFGPIPSKGIVDEYYPEAVFKQDQLIVNINAKLTPNFNVMGFYNYTSAHADTGTASNSYNLSQDYGRASFAPSNMLFLMANYQAPWGDALQSLPDCRGGQALQHRHQQRSERRQLLQQPAVACRCIAVHTSADATTTPHYAQTSFGCLNTQPTSSDTLIPINKANGPAEVTLMLRVSRSFGIGPKVTSAAARTAADLAAVDRLRAVAAAMVADPVVDRAVVDRAAASAPADSAAAADGLRAECSTRLFPQVQPDLQRAGAEPVQRHQLRNAERNRDSHPHHRFNRGGSRQPF